MEIGSEFLLLDEFDYVETIDNVYDYILKNYMNIHFFDSGRSSLEFVLRQHKGRKTALVPNYICSSVLKPFKDLGFKLDYYDIGIDFIPNIEERWYHEEIGVFLHLGYFGFPSNKVLSNFIEKVKLKNTTIIEDVTHTLFSRKSRLYSDYRICSIRKWFGLPDGGFVSSNEKLIMSYFNINSSFINLRLKAFKMKSEYLVHDDKKNEKKYLKVFNRAEEILNNTSICAMSLESERILKGTTVSSIIEKRVSNYNFLYSKLSNSSYVKIPFELTKETIPLFLPVLFNEKYRDIFRKGFIDSSIFTPVHWKEPFELINQEHRNDIYQRVLSIPCDQRYDHRHMQHIVDIFDSLVGDLNDKNLFDK